MGNANNFMGYYKKNHTDLNIDNTVTKKHQNIA